MDARSAANCASTLGTKTGKQSLMPRVSTPIKQQKPTRPIGSSLLLRGVVDGAGSLPEEPVMIARYREANVCHYGLVREGGARHQSLRGAQSMTQSETTVIRRAFQGPRGTGN